MIHWTRAAVADLCIFLACCMLFLGYHLWLFVVRPLQPFHRKSYFDIYSAAHKSRCAPAEQSAHGSLQSAWRARSRCHVGCAQRGLGGGAAG